MLNLTESTSSIIVEISRGLYSTNVDGINRTFEIKPELIGYIVIRACLKYLCSAKFANLRPSTRRNEFLKIRDFFDYLGTLDYPVALSAKTLLYPNYFNYLKNKKTATTNSIRSEVNIVSKALKYFLSQSSNQGDIEIAQRLIPTNRALKKPSPKRPKLSMSEIFPHCPYSNLELLHSLRIVCSWIINRTAQERNELLDNENVVGELRHIFDDLCFSSYPIILNSSLSSRQRTLNSSQELSARKIYGEMLKTAAQSKNSMLVNRAFRSIIPAGLKNRNYRSPSVQRMRELLNDCIKFDTGFSFNLIKNHSKSFGNEFGNSHGGFSTNYSFTIRDLVLPTYVENLSLAYILASDRVQTAALQSMRVDDFSISERTLVYSHYKFRSNKTIPFTSPEYKRQSYIYQAIKYFVELTQQSESYIADAERNLFNPHCGQFWRFALGPLTSYEYLFGDLCVADSIPRNQCEMDLLGDEKPFLWLMENVLSNHEAVKERIKQEDYRRNYGTVKKRIKNVIKTTLSVDNIGRSRVLLDQSTFDDAELDDPEVAAALTKHTQKTKREVYLARSREPEHIIKQSHFPRQVGEKMMEDASKLSFMLENTEVVDLEKASSLLGLKAPAASLEEISQKMIDDLEFGLFGELTFSDKTVIIKSEVTSALIQAYVKKLDSVLSSVFEKNTKTFQSLMTKKIYLLEILDQFPAHLKKAGSELQARLNFEFPELFEAHS